MKEDIEQIQQRIEDRDREVEDEGPSFGPEKLANESRRDYLIRTGKITPFSKLLSDTPGASTSVLQDALADAEDERDEELALAGSTSQQPASHRRLVRPGFDYGDDDRAGLSHERSPKRRRIGDPSSERDRYEEELDPDKAETGRTKSTSPISDDEYVETGDHVASDAEPSSDEWEVLPDAPGRKARGTQAKESSTRDHMEDFKGVDDGNENFYQTRLRDWVQRRSQVRNRTRKETADLSDSGSTHQAITRENRDEVSCEAPLSAPEVEEWFLPHPSVPDALLGEEFKIPGDIYPYLFDYQKTGVQWLWELYRQRVGGIIGDEMGLGKTIQIISFLAGLHYTKNLTQPVIVVCPPTVMKQWVDEFHRWWPPLRVSVLHSSGSGMVNIKRESYADDRLMSQAWDSEGSKATDAGQKAAKRILNRVLQEGHVLVTTYSGLQTYAPLLIPVEWTYAILDEGHKIRNPDTAITIHCKELRTAHRLILSGTPMQNNLTELWSLFDFVYPMRLGTLVDFRNQFEFPIRQGGYANASNLQVQTAARCAETLKDAISPYLLQRFKVDVAADLPKKSEQVLFCKLTKTQRAAYESFLGSNDMDAIVRGRRDVLYGVDLLRKICNHPDLADHRSLSLKSGYNYGSGAKSGKMQVVKALLEIWKDTGHKTLLFAQHRIMLDILEKFLKTLGGFKYLRMDGNTPIKVRQSMVDNFNRNPDIHVFLLTTKVGGIGVNLTGADRVIIYDPDWNPSTDIQARERAWRLGQEREVTIYRLMTAGTIEEKIYHRQIFKQFLTNKILKDPKQRQTFQMSDLHDLFSLGNDGPTDTSKLFEGADVKFEEKTGGDTASKADSSATKPHDEADQQQQQRRRRDGQRGHEENMKISQAAGVASLEKYQGASDTGDETKDEKPAADSSNSDDRLMENIFARSGVHSALEHDQIVGGKRTVKADPKIIEAEAKRMAANAAKELLKAEEVARTVPAGTPTWTGQFGTAGRREDTVMPRGTTSAYGETGSGARRATGGPPSANIIANLANRTAGGAGSGPVSSPRATTPRSGTNTPQGKDFMVMIRDYIIAHGGSVHTQMLVDHFNRFCDSPRASAEFREMLRTIAVLEKTGNRTKGKWVLKPEYAK